jgi:protein SCO1
LNGWRSAASRLRLAAAAGLLVAAAAVWVGSGGAEPPAATPVPGFAARFALTTAEGTPVTEASYRGKWLLVYFGYTYCPDLCPTALAALAGAVERLGPAGARVQPLFITVDPERDTPAILAAYVQAFGGHLAALRGNEAETAAAARAFRVSYARRDLGDGSYAMDHSSYIYVVDPQGRLVGLVTADSAAHDLAARLQGLLAGAAG